MAEAPVNGCQRLSYSGRLYRANANARRDELTADADGPIFYD